MKLKSLLLTFAVGLLTLAAEKAAALPLDLISLSGTITYNDQNSYDNPTNNKVKVAAVTLKQVLNVVSNEISLRTSGTNAPPAKSRIVFDPYTYRVYVTNNNGYFYAITEGYPDYNGFASVEINDIATTFRRVGTNGVVESDVIKMYFSFSARPGSDGSTVEFRFDGRGKLNYSVNPKTGRATMSLTGAGSGYGESQRSDDGVFTGSVVFAGSGTPEWEGSYSSWWY